jgi:hypothetical protein
VIVAVELAHPKLGAHGLQSIRRARTERRQFQIGNARNGLGVDFPEPPEPDHSDTQTLHLILP